MMAMQAEYSVKLRCATCGRDDHFEFNEDKSYVKCTFCNREYIGGIEELKEFNTDAFDKVKEQIEKDAIKHIHDELKKAFRGNKFIKFK